eukprot:gene11807-8118_t
MSSAAQQAASANRRHTPPLPAPLPHDALHLSPRVLAKLQHVGFCLREKERIKYIKTVEPLGQGSYGKVREAYRQPSAGQPSAGRPHQHAPYASSGSHTHDGPQRSPHDTSSLPEGKEPHSGYMRVAIKEIDLMKLKDEAKRLRVVSGAIREARLLRRVDLNLRPTVSQLLQELHGKVQHLASSTPHKEVMTPMYQMMAAPTGTERAPKLYQLMRVCRPGYTLTIYSAYPTAIREVPLPAPIAALQCGEYVLVDCEFELPVSCPPSLGSFSSRASVQQSTTRRPGQRAAGPAVPGSGELLASGSGSLSVSSATQECCTPEASAQGSSRSDDTISYAPSYDGSYSEETCPRLGLVGKPTTEAAGTTPRRGEAPPPAESSAAPVRQGGVEEAVGGRPVVRTTTTGEASRRLHVDPQRGLAPPAACGETTAEPPLAKGSTSALWDRFVSLIRPKAAGSSEHSAAGNGGGGGPLLVVRRLICVNFELIFFFVTTVLMHDDNGNRIEDCRAPYIKRKNKWLASGSPFSSVGYKSKTTESSHANRCPHSFASFGPAYGLLLAAPSAHFFLFTFSAFGERPCQTTTTTNYKELQGNESPGGTIRDALCLARPEYDYRYLLLLFSSLICSQRPLFYAIPFHYFLLRIFFTFLFSHSISREFRIQISESYLILIYIHLYIYIYKNLYIRPLYHLFFFLFFFIPPGHSNYPFLPLLGLAFFQSAGRRTTPRLPLRIHSAQKEPSTPHNTVTKDRESRLHVAMQQPTAEAGGTVVPEPLLSKMRQAGFSFNDQERVKYIKTVEPLGQGSYGKVREAYRQPSAEDATTPLPLSNGYVRVAIKEIDLMRLKDEAKRLRVVSGAIREARLLRRVPIFGLNDCLVHIILFA